MVCHGAFCRLPRGRSALALLFVLGQAAAQGCGDGGGSNTGAGGRDAGQADAGGDAIDGGVADEAGAEPTSDALSFEVDETRSEAALITASAGGELSATGEDGAVYTLTVPAFAVASDVQVNLIPLTSLAGISASGPLAGVLLRPEGLVFQRAATLRIRHPALVDAADELAFEATDDGTSPGAAVIDHSADGHVLRVRHFRLYGVAVPSTDERAAVLAIATDDPELALEHALGAVLAERRRARLAGEGAPTTDPSDAYARYEADLLAPLRAQRDTSCDARAAYLSAALEYAALRALVAAPPGDALLSELLDTYTRSAAACDAEALNLCRISKDAGYLLEFQLREARAQALLADAGLLDAGLGTEDLDALYADTLKRCAAYGYGVSADSQGLVLSGRLDDPRYAFSLSGTLDGAAVTIAYSPNASNANAGSYGYALSGGLSGMGSYTLSESADGTITLVQSGERCTASGCAASEDRVTLTPL